MQAQTQSNKKRLQTGVRHSKKAKPNKTNSKIEFFYLMRYSEAREDLSKYLKTESENFLFYFRIIANMSRMNTTDI